MSQTAENVENSLQAIPPANAPIKLGVTKAALKKLEAKWKKVPDAATKEGYAKIQEAKRELTPLRTGVEAERKIQVASAVEHQRKVNAVAKTITETIAGIEAPLYAEKKRVDDEAARLKLEKEQAEARRVAEIESKVDDINELTQDLLGADLETLEERLKEAQAVKVTAEEYMEFVEQASMFLGQALQQLEAAIVSKKAIDVQQAEINERQAEQDKRDALASIKEKIANIKMIPVEVMGISVNGMQNTLGDLLGIEVDGSYGDLAEEAMNAIAITQAKLEAMINQQKNLDDQHRILDEKQKKIDDDAAAEEQRKKDEDQKKVLADRKVAAEAALAARLPEDIKVRMWNDSIIALEVPEVADPQLKELVRNATLLLEDLNKMIYTGTQSPADEDGDKVE